MPPLNQGIAARASDVIGPEPRQISEFFKRGVLLQLLLIELMQVWSTRGKASSLPRRQIALVGASVKNCAVIVALIDQPTTRRQNKLKSARFPSPA
jgi:hypothetical protein